LDSKVNLVEKLSTFSDHWAPRTVAQLNNYDVMVVKAKGEFVWHKHDQTDDFFLVLSGELEIQQRDKMVTLGPGDLYVVKRGVEHRPVAKQEVHLLLIEPAGTPNTGDKASALLAALPNAKVTTMPFSPAAAANSCCSGAVCWFSLPKKLSPNHAMEDQIEGY
jgi:mannose-6-phosphate isomerase-like protein (cupin superfamily)